MSRIGNLGMRAVRDAFLLVGCLGAGAGACTAVYEYDECRVPGQCSREDSAELCVDGDDNDGDSLVDCFDPSCNAFCVESTEGLCADGIDNDGDALADCDDPDCGATDRCTENTEAKCSDGVDNNLDGDTDCADRACCGTQVCHELEVCGELVLEDDFSAGIDEARWMIHAASSGYPGSLCGLDVGSEGLMLHAQTSCYTYGEEVGVIAREPLDLTRGRFFVTARIRVLPDTYWPAYLALVPHLRTGDFIVKPGGDGDPCGAPVGATSEVRQNPVILHRLYGDGTRNLWQRYGTGGTDMSTYPPDPLVFPLSLDKEEWEVRMDIDDEEIVLFEKQDAAWLEVGRAPNLLPGRELYLAIVASTDSSMSGQDNQFAVQHVAVYRYELSRWSTIYEERFDTDPAWSGTNADHCTWDSGEHAMGATFVADSGETCLATLPIAWEGQSFRLRYDMRATRVDDAAHFAPLLYDASASFAYGLKAGAGLNWNGTTHNVMAYACAEIMIVGIDNPIDRWLRATVFYDAASETLEVDVVDRDSAEQVAWVWTPEASCVFDFRHFGFSVRGYDRYAGQTAVGLVDNVTFMVREGE